MRTSLCTMPSGKNVFILDDSALILELAADRLTARGYSVYTAENLAQFEANAAAHHADIVVLDVNLPEVFGDDVAAVLRDVREWSVPVVLFSGLDEIELAQRAQAAGAADWICKRDGIDAMIARIDAVLAGTSF